ESRRARPTALRYAGSMTARAGWMALALAASCGARSPAPIAPRIAEHAAVAPSVPPPDTVVVAQAPPVAEPAEAVEPTAPPTDEALAALVFQHRAPTPLTEA